MKKRVLAFLCALLLLTGAVPFAAAQEGETLRAADALHTLGLINGTGASGYALESPATRAQAAVLLVRLAGAQQDAAADNWFSGYRDVPAWASRAVHYAVHQGWIDSPASPRVPSRGGSSLSFWKVPCPSPTRTAPPPSSAAS